MRGENPHTVAGLTIYDHIVLIGKDDPFAAHFRLVIFRDRQQFEVFGDLGLLLDAVNAAGRGVDETLDPHSVRPIDQLHRRQAADLPGQLRVEVAARIVCDARQMDDGVDAAQIDLLGIPHVPFDDGEVRMRFEEIAEPLKIEDRDLMAAPQQLGRQNRALVAATASHKNLHNINVLLRNSKERRLSRTSLRATGARTSGPACSAGSPLRR